MGFEQAAGADAREVGHQHVVLGLVLDAAEQRPEQRVVLDDDGSAVRARVVDHQVDAVARQHLGQRLLALGLVVGLAALEQLQVLEQVDGDLLEPGAELARVLDLLLQALADRLQLALEQWLDGLQPERGHALVERALERPGQLEEAQDLGAQLAFALVVALARLLRQAGELGLGQALALAADQGQDQLATLAPQREVALGGKGRQRLVGLGLAFGVVMLELVLCGLEVGFGKALRDVGLQRLDQLDHGLAQLASLAGGQAQRARALGRIEVVQVAQVGRGRTPGSGGLHLLLQQGRAPGADVAEHEQVVVRVVEPEPEAGRGQRALLADPGQFLLRQFGRVGKAELGGIELQAQLGGSESDGGHAGSLVCRSSLALNARACLASRHGRPLHCLHEHRYPRP